MQLLIAFRMDDKNQKIMYFYQEIDIQRYENYSTNPN